MATTFHLYLSFYTLIPIIASSTEPSFSSWATNLCLILPLILNVSHILHSSIDLMNEGKNAILNFKNESNELSFQVIFHQLNKFFLASGMGILFFHYFNSYSAFLLAFIGIFADDAMTNTANDSKHTRPHPHNHYALYGIKQKPTFKEETINKNNLSLENAF